MILKRNDEIKFEREGQWASILHFSPLLLVGDNMIRYPCKGCIVLACCTETCVRIAEYWSKIYESYKTQPEMTVVRYGLNEKHAETLKHLYNVAGHRPVVFTPNRDILTVSIDFSIYELSSINDPPHPVEAKLHDSKKPM